MARHCPAHPAYRFSVNKGYPSPEHQAALAERGPCRLHRLTWEPVTASLRLPVLVQKDDR
jgi:ribonuclease HII